MQQKFKSEINFVSGLTKRGNLRTVSTGLVDRRRDLRPTLPPVLVICQVTVRLYTVTRKGKLKVYVP